MREALVNCLVNADYFLPRGVVIKKDADQVILENPGSIRTGKEQMLRGGISDPRNKTLLKMFNIIGIGERAGSGVPDIYAVWDKEGWTAPKIEEQYGPDRTILTLGFLPKPTIKTDDKKPTIKTDEKKSAVKSDIKKDMIREYLKDKDSAKTADIAVAIGLGITRTKELIYDMPDVEALGGNRNRTYRLKQ